VSIYYGGTVKRDRYGYVEFIDMQSVPVLHVEKAKKRAGTHEVTCFDHVTRSYEVKHTGGTTSDDEV
jgi:hypothetical protein